jgi:hypothetical protein
MKIYEVVCKECSAEVYPYGTAALLEEPDRVAYMRRHNQETGHENFVCEDREQEGEA